MEIFGFALALLIGLTLGLIGGGGSILALPVLVYFLGVPELEATTYSFFIVGLTAWFGSAQKAHEKLVHFKAALIFGIPSILSVYFSRWVLLPKIPNDILFLGVETTKSTALMLFFSLIMIFAGFSTLPKRKKKHHKNHYIEPDDPHQVHPHQHHHNNNRWALLSLFGLIEGLITGLVGAGGGFLIIPLLIFFGKIHTKKAMATSLLIIAVKSTLGFAGDWLRFSPNWSIILPFACIAIVGIFIGNKWALKIKGKTLKFVFSLFLIGLGIVIFVSELIA